MNPSAALKIFRNITALGLLLAISQLASCKKTPPQNCVPVSGRIDIPFEDSTAREIRFSPFEAGKVWVKFQGNTQETREFDIKTKQQSILGMDRTPFFFPDQQNGASAYRQEDAYDSLIWIGGPNRNGQYYDRRTKEINELPVQYVTRIISKPDKVYFVSRQGFCYWDRSKKIIEQVPGIPPDFIQSSVHLNDSIIILDAKYTYNFNTNQFKTGIYFDQYKYGGEQHSFKAEHGICLFYKENSIWLKGAGELKKLPLPYNNLDQTKIIGHQIWQWDSNCFYRYDTKTGDTTKYGYYLPAANNYYTDYQLDDEYIRIQRPGQLHLIDVKDGKQYECPIGKNDGFITSISDDCNLYVLYKNRLVITPKAEFIKKCAAFDYKSYIKAIKSFHHAVDSIGIQRDTLQVSVLTKLNYLKSTYADAPQIEITYALGTLDYNAFQSVRYQFPKGYENCYRDTLLPFEHRKNCINALANEYGRSSDFEKVMQLDREFRKYFGAPVKEADYYFRTEVDSVKRYLFVLDSLHKAALAPDSLAYFKAMAWETICLTPWHCGEGCSGCDFSLVFNALKRFMVKYPQSELLDNAAYELLSIGFMYDYGTGESLVVRNKTYEKFARQHPETDMMPDVRYYIFENLIGMEARNNKEIRKAGQRFIREFGSDKRAEYVKLALKDLGEENE